MSEANKAVMWAAKDVNGEIHVDFSKSDQTEQRLMARMLTIYQEPFPDDLKDMWERFYGYCGWQLIQVEVREIVNPENTQP